MLTKELTNCKIIKYHLAIVFLLVSIARVFAQHSIEYEEVSFITADQISINASFCLPDSRETSYPAIILIHQGGSSRKEWIETQMPQILVQNGYAVLLYDVRIHGTSGSDKGDLKDLFDNPERSPFDLQAAIEFLGHNEKVDQSAIGIIGASIGANLACVASASDKYKIKSIVSMSAKVSAVQNLSGTKEMLSFSNAFYIASENEQDGMRKRWAYELYELTNGQRALKIAPGNAHGSYILREQPALQNEILDWFNKTL